jgi:hypothetical protein
MGQTIDPSSPEGTVQRRLKARHLAMIALGGTIGTGLFVGSGGALASGGPVGTLLGYVCTIQICSYLVLWLMNHVSVHYGDRCVLHDDCPWRDGHTIPRFRRLYALRDTMSVYALT